MNVFDPRREWAGRGQSACQGAMYQALRYAAGLTDPALRATPAFASGAVNFQTITNQKETEAIMLPKYSIEYSVQFGRQSQTYHYAGDDPVACEEFLSELLERGFRIKAIRHEGVDLNRADFDRLLKTAAAMLAAKSLRTALGISTEEEHHRFGFTA